MTLNFSIFLFVLSSLQSAVNIPHLVASVDALIIQLIMIKSHEPLPTTSRKLRGRLVIIISYNHV